MLRFDADFVATCTNLVQVFLNAKSIVMNGSSASNGVIVPGSEQLQQKLYIVTVKMMSDIRVVKWNRNGSEKGKVDENVNSRYIGKKFGKVW